MEIEKKEYGTYVKEITPVHSTVKNMLRAFLAGGAVCTIGQACLGLYGSMGMEKETAAAWTTLTLIAASVLLTGLGLYQRIVKFAGARSPGAHYRLCQFCGGRSHRIPVRGPCVRHRL